VPLALSRKRIWLSGIVGTIVCGYLTFPFLEGSLISYIELRNARLAYQYLSKHNNDPINCGHELYPYWKTGQYLTQADIADQFLQLARETFKKLLPSNEAFTESEVRNIESSLFGEFKRCVIAKGANGCRNVEIEVNERLFRLGWEENVEAEFRTVNVWIEIASGAARKTQFISGASTPGCQFTGKIG
jgi:hypothetical protein